MALRGFDARILMWLLAIAFASGVPLMVRFEADAALHAEALAHPGWQALRTVHATSTLALVIGTLGHVVMRWRSGSDKGLRTGSLALAAVAVAAVTGALTTQTRHADAVARSIGLDSAPAVAAAVGHIAYATVFVLLTVYFHVARWGWGHVFGRRSQATWAIAIAAGIGVALPAALPGEAGGGATTWLVPAWRVASLWTFIVAGGLYVAARLRRGGRRAVHTHAGSDAEE